MRTTLIGLTTLCVSWGSYAHAYDNLTDAVPGKYFDPATSVAEDGVLSIGLHTGINPTTWQPRDFQARNGVAADALTFTLAECAGQLAYTLSGVSTIQRNGATAIVAQLTVDGVPQIQTRRFVAAGVGRTDAWSITVTGECGHSIEVSASLFAQDGAVGAASVRVVEATVTTE